MCTLVAYFNSNTPVLISRLGEPLGQNIGASVREDGVRFAGGITEADIVIAKKLERSSVEFRSKDYVRPAGGGDRAVSPAPHALQRQAGAFAVREGSTAEHARYSGAVRLAVIIGGGIAAWVGVIAIVQAFF
jgi:hypothetical protein